MGVTARHHAPQTPCECRPVRYIVVSGDGQGGLVMSHGVHAVQHEVDHQIEHEETAHGGHDGLEGRNKKIALLIAVIALFLAFSETLGKSAQTMALSYNVEASNLWAFFQAKTIRQTALQVGNEVLKIDRLKVNNEPIEAVKKALDDRIENWTKTIDRYNSEPTQRPAPHEIDLNPPYGEGRRELMALAQAAERKRDVALERYHHYEIASAAFQIGIVLASATVITGMIILSWIAGGLGLVGLLVMGLGYFNPELLHSLHLI